MSGIYGTQMDTERERSAMCRVGTECPPSIDQIHRRTHGLPRPTLLGSTPLMHAFFHLVQATLLIALAGNALAAEHVGVSHPLTEQEGPGLPEADRGPRPQPQASAANARPHPNAEPVANSQPLSERDARTDAREQANLLAQQMNAEATRWQSRLAGPALVLSFLSTVAVAVALVFTARANKTSLNALEHARWRDKHELRAYVYIHTFKSVRVLNPDGSVAGCSVSLEWKNFGSTPALGVRSCTFTCVWHNPVFPDWFPFPEMPALWGPEGGDINHIAQGSTKSITSSMVIPLGHIEEISKGWMRVFAWGEITYKDIFGETHRTKFCYRSSGAGFEQGDRSKPIIQFHLYPSNNSADDECVAEELARPKLPDDVDRQINQGSGVGWYLWMDAQRPSTYEQAPDGTPVDCVDRDSFGIKKNSDR